MAFNNNDRSSVDKFFKAAMEMAEQIANSKDRTYQLSREAVHKAGNNQRSLAKIWSQFLDLIDMVRMWSRGAYPNVPVRTLLFSIAALVYFINPLDAIPDPIPFAGYIDDSMIIGFVLAAIRVDLEHFHHWKISKTKPQPSEDATEDDTPTMATNERKPNTK